MRFLLVTIQCDVYMLVRCLKSYLGAFSVLKNFDVQSKLFIWAHIYIIESIYIRDLLLLLFFAELNALLSARMNPE